MAEDPIRDIAGDIINVGLYDDTYDPVVLSEWQSRNWPTFSYFYDRRYEHEEYTDPLNHEVRITATTPDRMFMQWLSGSYHVIAYYYPVELESAPPLSHTNNFQVEVLLYTQDIFVDPGGDNGGGGGGACRTAPAACKPVAELELSASPIAELTIVLSPIAAITQNEIPAASLECRINT